jgi:hypothetical protein
MLLVLLAAFGGVAVAQANVPPPGERYLRSIAVITLAEPAGDWVYFSEPSGDYGVKKLGQAGRFVIPSPGWSGTFTKPYVVVWAVRASVCSGLSNEAVEARLRVWHQQGAAVCSERIELGYWRGSLFDVNDDIEKHYRIERTDVELKVQPLGEHRRLNGIVLTGWAIVAVGIASLVGWLLLRWRKLNRRLTRTTPPPEENE